MGNERDDGFRDAMEVAATAEYEFHEEYGASFGASALLEALRDALATREARSHLAAGTWTSQPPVISAPYWLKRPGESAQVVRVEIFHPGGPGTVYEPGCDDTPLSKVDSDALWHGPLSEPE